MSLLNYWPSLEEINRCIKAEAENSSDEVLLAVHQQFPLAYLKVGSDGKVMPDSRTPSTEDELISYFIGSAPSGSHVLPITGASGVGKSHLIRILDARLRRLADADRFLIIRIPKSASLRRVVELILEAEPLQEPKYDPVKAEFTKALADVPLHEAVIRFQAELTIALNEYALSLRQSLEQDMANTSLRERFAHAMDLPKLMADADTASHFKQTVFPRIIQRSVSGVASEDGEMKEIDPTSSQFSEEDLDLSGIDLRQANKQVVRYCDLNLNAQGGRGKSVAVSVLNEVVDKATRQLYQLNQSLGGMTLAEVILEIRRLLLLDNRELVILVEDFAALVGIQDTLAKVLIQEGETSKGKEFATIRSVIAVTDGYLAGRETLATRAGREWVVESRLESDAETLKRTKALVASYLNAARHGENGLKEHYRLISLEADSSKIFCSPPAYIDENEEDAKVLNAFGFVGDVPIFPFTEAAIEILARVNLKSGDTLVFTPRSVIKNIIREILLQGRDAFVNQQFPPPSINLKRASADVAQWLASLHVSDEQRKRYERLVTIWGNDPKTRSEIGSIPNEVFEVFNLPQPGIDYIPPVSAPKPIRSGESPTGIMDSEVVYGLEQKVSEYHVALENWVQNGTRLEQTIANKIRKALEILVNQRIDWNAERCRKRSEIKSGKFSIPYAGGEQGLDANAIMIAPSNEDPDGRLRGDLLALLRHCDVYKYSTDYVGADEDLARIANLVERLMPEALKIVRTSVKKQNQTTILALAANSRLLGINERGCTPTALSSFLFCDADKIESVPNNARESFKEWVALQNKAAEIRPQLWKLLLDTNGCFQGAGNTAYGIDMVRLVEDYPDDGATIAFEDLPPALKQDLQNTSDIRRVMPRLKRLLEDAKEIQKSIVNDLGTDFDKQTVLSTFKDLATTLKDMGAWSDNEIGISSRGFLELCEAFRSAAIKVSLSVLQGVEESDDNQLPEKKIMCGSKLPLSPLLITEHFLSCANKVVSAAVKHAQTLELQYQGVSPGEKAQELTEVFDNLIANMLCLQKTGEK